MARLVLYLPTMRTMVCAILLTVAVTAADWTDIAKWSGSGTKETESFEVKSREWRLTWTAKAIDPTYAGSGTFRLSVQVMKDGSAIPVSVVTAGPGETQGESFVRGAGRYFLKVSSVNAQWTLAVQEPK